jgi:type II secretory pathway pseudopilin PulG
MEAVTAFRVSLCDVKRRAFSLDFSWDSQCNGSMSRGPFRGQNSQGQNGTEDSMTISSLTNRRALTLVEMLVGMAITLVMMAAVVNLFANISEGVRNRRATMEVAANLRIARARLYNDLAGATCLKYPKDAFGWMPQPDVNNPPDGYFEIVEGIFADENPPLLPLSERGTSLIPSSNAIFDAQGNPNTAGEYTDGGARGDYDDILAMTVESESERFRGKGRGLRPGGDPDNFGTPPNYTDGDWVDMAISSPVAEVIWYAVQIQERAEGEPGMRKVYRRTLLITPWYGTATNSLGTGSDPLLDLVARGFTTYAAQIEQLRLFQEAYDISVRLENGRIVPNTLADLSRRENRFAHAPNDSITPASSFPHQFPYNVNNVFNYYQPDPEEDIAINDGSLRRLVGERQNEDLVLDNVLAFDVQVFDPGAPLYNYQNTQLNACSSVAFVEAVFARRNSTTGPTQVTGFGGYADLGWNDVRDMTNLANNVDSKYNGPNYMYDYTTISGSPLPLFQQERRLGWHPTIDHPELRRNPSVYDTWTTYYETDQSNQELAPFYSNLPAPPVPWVAWQSDIIDQGANGLDENNVNGPDDPLERETSPPYPYALRGVQVKLRIYEPESRQIRETTVTRNLVK